jgi:hypothetical protein
MLTDEDHALIRDARIDVADLIRQAELGQVRREAWLETLRRLAEALRGIDEGRGGGH